MLYADKLPYMKTLNRRVYLPIGSNLGIGKGNLCFLLSKSVEDSIKMMNEPVTFSSNKKYRWYFYNLRYIGKIGIKKFRDVDRARREEIYNQVNEKTSVIPYRGKLLIQSYEKKNTYYELCKYYEIFSNITQSYQPFKTIDLFWNFFKPIFTDQYGKLKNKFVLVNVNSFDDFKGKKLKEQIRNPIFLIYYTLWKRYDYVRDLDIDFFFYCNGKVLRVNPSKCDEKTGYRTFLREIKKLYAVASIPEVESIDENDIKEDSGEPVKKEETIIEKEVKAPTVARVIRLIGAKMTPAIEARITKHISVSSARVAHVNKTKILATKLDKSVKVKVNPTEIIEDIKKDAEEGIDKDEELIKEIYDTMQKDRVPEKSVRSSARDEQLRQEQKDINVKNMKLKDLEKKKDEDIPVLDVSNEIKSTNPNVKKIKFNNFNKVYQEEMMTKDIISCFTNLNNRSIKMFIRDIQVVDTSNELNYKETWTVKLEDENRNRHTIKVDIPKFLENQFLYLGGNRKYIKNQMFFLPLVKISENRVLVVSNYNKLTITRIDTRSIHYINILTKLIEKSDITKTKFEAGNSFYNNKSYVTTLEYDDLSKHFMSFKTKGIQIYFNQDEAQAVASRKNIKMKPGYLFIGLEDQKPIFIHTDKQKDDKNRSISEIILNSLSDEEKSIAKKIKSPKRLMHTMVTTMKQDIPLGLLICLWEGISTVLNKAKIKYRLSGKLNQDITEDYIKFKNCYLIYEATVQNELLLNGLKMLDTEHHDISEYDKQDAYVPFITKKFGRINALNTLNNAYEFMLGAVEKEILADMNLPTEIVELLIHANLILCDSQYENELSQNLSRIRSSEVVSAILYDKIAKAYTPFKNSNGKKKLSIPQDAVIKELLKQKTVEDYSSLNPFLELETNHGVSTKGFRGINLDDSYTVPKRCYDDTMIGIIGPSSSPDANVGVNRGLTMEPNIKTARGYVDIKNDKLDEVKDINLFSPAELLIPMGVTHDDPTRTGHSVKQSRHVIPVQKSSPVLISNGADEVCKYYLSSDFVVNAKMDGVVVEKDEKTKLMVVEYKDGTHRAISLDKTLVKNGGGGFELSNILVTDLKVGDKFKKNATLAWHKDFFTKNDFQGTRVNVGVLAKVAIACTDVIHEDCTFVTRGFSNKSTTEMCFKKPVTIGRNSNVSQIVKVGDTINVDDPLIQFDDSFEESDINALLRTLGDNENLKDAVISNNRNIVKSKYSGVIEDIKMYSTADLEELSPSLQKIFSAYYNKIKQKKKVLAKYNESDGIVHCGLMINEPTGKVEPNRYGTIRGEKVKDGVLIEFYIKHEEPLEVGSKVANFTALKGEVGEVIEEGYEPFSELEPNEDVDTMISPISILARMTPSLLLTGFGNKCIIYLKRRLNEIWTSSHPFEQKRRMMEDLIYKTFSALDRTGANTKQYKEMFEPMTDNRFSSFFKTFFANEDMYLILTIVDYERTVKMDDIEKAAKILNLKLYEYVYFPHVNHDKENPVSTPDRVPVIYINVKRTQQTVAKKNGISTSIDERSAITGQVVRHDKNGRESDLENIMLTSLGLKYTLKELNGPRADDLVMKQQMMQNINTKGYVQLNDLEDRIENKTTLNTVNTYFLGMGLKTDLVTKGLKLISTIKNE